MQIVTFNTPALDGPRVGAMEGESVVDLTQAFEIASVRELIGSGRLRRAEDVLASDGAVRVQDFSLDLPMPDASRIFCIGVNYLNRNEEYRDGTAAPENPSIFMRTPASFVPHNRPLVIPNESNQLDYEGEIVLVIGRPGRRVPQDKAHGHIAGLTIMNEGTIRDWVRHAKFNVTQGKNFDRTGGLGPWIETDLEGLDLQDMEIETRVNGELRQRDTTASMAFPFAKIIEYVSTFTALQPGDLIATGTPTGAGARLDPPVWLREGDVVEVSVEGVGTLVNGVVEEPRPSR